MRMKTKKSFKRFRIKTSKRKYLKKRTIKNKKGGAADEQTFNTLNELNNYLNKNSSWISNVNVFTKEDYSNNQRSKYQFDKKNLSGLYELEGDIKNYVFHFY